MNQKSKDKSSVSSKSARAYNRSVNKGEPVHVAKNGTASVDGSGDMIGIVLESNDRHEETLVECILKL